MRRFLLDSNAVNRFAYRRFGVYERAMQERRAGGVVGTALPIVAEVLAGVERSKTRDLNKPVLDRELKILTKWPLDLDAVYEYARIHALLRNSGFVMQVIDQMAAAIAMSLGRCTVVTTDSDFQRVAGLSVENWCFHNSPSGSDIAE